jgi:hypothetical protein
MGQFLAPFPQGPQNSTDRSVYEVGRKQQEYLCSLIKTHRGLRDLAVNPLALTMMAFMQLNNRDVLQHRFDLYQAITRTLLDTWNRESGRKMLTEEELSLVEDLLSRFANRLLNDAVLLRTHETVMITRQAMADFYRLQLPEIKAHHSLQLLETIRRSSGLFGEVGDNLLCFANQTFQDYFAALYLIREQGEINAILQAILDTPESSAIVQRNLLFVISCIVNGRLLVSNKALRARIRSNAEYIVQQQAV